MPLPTDDLLSAFHDGESTPSERAAVEQRLAISADARRELSEIKQLSAMLKELPCDRLPSEFPQQVLRVIEREMLIPSRPASSMDSEPSSSSRRWVGAVAVLTSAAGLLLLVQALNDRAGRNEPKLANVTGSPVPFSAAAETAIDSPLSMAKLDSAVQSSNGSLGGAAGPNRLTENSPTDTTDGARIAGGFGGGNLYFDQAALGAADVGDVVRAIQRTEGDEVAVVFLTVVDRKKGLEGLQLLLTKNQIVPSGDEAIAKANRSSTPAVPSGEMEAVLVRSSAAQLETALKQLRDENYLQGLEVDQPILLAELGEARNSRATSSDKAFAEDAKPENAKSSPELTSSVRRAKTEVQDSLELKKQVAATAAAKPSEKRDQKELSANQTRYGVSAEMLQQNQLSQQTRARVLAKGAVRGPSPAEKDANRSDDQRPLQVLFVVVDQTQAGKSQALPGSLSRPAAAPAKTRSEPAKPSGQDGAA